MTMRLTLTKSLLLALLRFPMPLNNSVVRLSVAFGEQNRKRITKTDQVLSPLLVPAGTTRSTKKFSNWCGAI
jgi:hypothetical protein